MDILKAEIARKRKQLEDAKVVTEGKKYFKRAELIAKEEEAYLANSALQLAKEATNAALDPKQGSSTGSTIFDSCSRVEDLPKLTRREVTRRLRERGEPITLFGENELEAFKRLRKLEILEPEVNRGLRNDLQAALEQVDQAYLEEILKTSKVDSSSSGPQEKKKLGDVHIQEDDYSFEDICEMAKTVFRNRKDLEGHAQMILKWLKFLLKTWGHHLNDREEHEKLSTKGKLASATYTQTVVSQCSQLELISENVSESHQFSLLQEYLKPLMRKLKTNTLMDDILESLAEIVNLMLAKEYIKANDAYLEMAIGNAPWPIGVTMVGIHARTGREKIFSRNVAHVMNDETQRKYIQGLKRLMTKCQIMFPAAPSKCVEYTPDSTLY